MENLTSYRKCNYEGIDELLWVTSDRGAFGNEGDGPLCDWIEGRDDFLSQVKNFDVVIQAGGNCGMYASFYKNYFKEVYTFEPNELNYYCLNINCTDDGYHKFYGGLGNDTKPLSISNGPNHNVGMYKIINQPGNIPMYLIDDLNLQKCDLIHLDIEGYEINALDGGKNTINKFKPVIIVEKSNDTIVDDYLQSMGYSVYKKLKMDIIYTYGNLENN